MNFKKKIMNFKKQKQNTQQIMNEQEFQALLIMCKLLDKDARDEFMSSITVSKDGGETTTLRELITDEYLDELEIK